MLTVDKNSAYPKAVKQSEEVGNLLSGLQLRKIKYLNNMVEQDYCFIKKRVRYMFGF
ncbi:DDE-type integrase/transposase/recombinase [Bacillus thuringiensis]|uniref:DDE-type integrase/transposase/recombinase n=1 Tax=Bacillus thuringiensis TaxID=1428 RepID=UPI00300033EE